MVKLQSYLFSNTLIKEYDGIIIELSYEDDIAQISNILQYISEIEPNRKLILIIEDIDTFLTNGNKSNTTTILNLLDGRLSVSNLVILSTTNYPETLAERIVNRPGRFNRRIEIGLPNKEVREYYLNNKLNDSKLVAEFANQTEGLNIDDIKEVLIRYKIYDIPINESVDDIMVNKQQKLVKNKKSGNSNVGFK